MKNFNLSLFLGCCAISIGVIVAGYLIASKLPDYISGNFSGTLTGNINEYGQTDIEYLSVYEVSGYLRIGYDNLNKLIESGELNGTYTIIEGSIVFSKEKLSEWMKNRIENEH